MEGCDLDMVARHVADATDGADLTVLCPNGTEHFRLSLLNNDENRDGQIHVRINLSMQNYNRWLTVLSHYVRSPAAVVLPPPPIESEELMPEGLGVYAEKVAAHGIAPAHTRLQAWQHQKRVIQDMAESVGLPLLELPAEIFSERGYLHDRFVGREPSHANEAYGELMLHHLAAFAAGLDGPEHIDIGWGGSGLRQDGDRCRG